MSDAIPVGLCQCGCGSETRPARQTRSDRGERQGVPVRYVRGHDSRTHFAQAVGANPDGRCWCGCGEETLPAPRTDLGSGWVKGQPLKYAPGHRKPLRLPLCGCGCGERVKRHAHRFLRGHRAVVGWEADNAGCWVWTGAVYSTGRPRWTDDLAYRRLYEREVGPIPAGCHLHHLCGNELCVNPNHLEPMSPSDHSRLHAAAGRGG